MQHADQILSYLRQYNACRNYTDETLLTPADCPPCSQERLNDLRFGQDCQPDNCYAHYHSRDSV
jgi:hypothetical protein